MKKIMLIVPTLLVLIFGIWCANEEAFASGKTENSQLNEFLKGIDSDNYEEFSNATGNIREVSEYKDVKSILENKGILKMVSETTYSGDPKIDPNTKIYFYATWKDSKSEFHFKYAIFDANSKKILVSGSDFKQKK